MRRRPGIAGIQQRRDASVALRVVGEDAERQHLEAMRAQLVRFRASLEAFALKHKAEIRADPVFRAQFHKMCANVGVDPLASNKGFWTELLGFGDFYYELGVQVAEACLASKAQDGGLCELTRLMSLVLARRGRAAQPVSEDDLLRAIERLQCLGGGWKVLTVGGKKVIRSVPVEFSPDQAEVIRVAAEGARVVRAGDGDVSISAEKKATAQRGMYPVGCVSRSALEAPPPSGMGWTRERARSACEQLVKCGVALVDDGDTKRGERLFWLPCVSARGRRRGE
jgi:ESCRT-II complex subunit VPS22